MNTAPPAYTPPLKQLKGVSMNLSKPLNPTDSFPPIPFNPDLTPPSHKLVKQTFGYTLAGLLYFIFIMLAVAFSFISLSNYEFSYFFGVCADVCMCYFFHMAIYKEEHFSGKPELTKMNPIWIASALFFIHFISWNRYSISLEEILAYIALNVVAITCIYFMYFGDDFGSSFMLIFKPWRYRKTIILVIFLCPCGQFYPGMNHKDERIIFTNPFVPVYQIEEKRVQVEPEIQLYGIILAVLALLWTISLISWHILKRTIPLTFDQLLASSAFIALILSLCGLLYFYLNAIFNRKFLAGKPDERKFLPIWVFCFVGIPSAALNFCKSTPQPETFSFLTDLIFFHALLPIFTYLAFNQNDRTKSSTLCLKPYVNKTKLSSRNYTIEA